MEVDLLNLNGIIFSYWMLATLNLIQCLSNRQLIIKIRNKHYAYKEVVNMKCLNCGAKLGSIKMI